MPPRGSWMWIGAAMAAILGTVAFLVAWNLGAFRSISSRELLIEAKAHLKKREYAIAERLAERIPHADALFSQAQILAGEAAHKAGRAEKAIEYYGNVERDGSQPAVLAALSMAELLRDSGRVSDAVREYAYVLKYQPDNMAAHQRVAFLLSITGQRWESLTHYFLLLKSDMCSFDELALVGDIDRVVKQEEYLRRCVAEAPDDILVILASGAQAVADGHPEEAQEKLKRVVAKEPGLLAAQSMLGELLLDSNPDALADWHSHLPPTADDSPEIWFVRGLWARHLDNLPAAARCFWEALRKDPTHRRGNYQLSQVLVFLDHPSAAEFKTRYSQLYELSVSLSKVLKSEGQDEQSIRQVATLLENTGRIWEACAWSSLAARTFPSADWARETLLRLSRQLNDSLPRTIVSADVSRKYDFSKYPTHEALLQQGNRDHDRPSDDPVHSSISFKEETEVGIDFVYQNGADPETKGLRMFEQMGGGVAVLDYDGDGAPDLFFTQGKPWRTGASEPTADAPLSDSLFRNLDGTSYVEVTQATGLMDFGFGQGCSAGDFDNDGFQDLYVANVGRNQLYRNNGDGTFADVTNQIDHQPIEWGASCVIVDLNADGLPDIFSVTYLTGKDIFEAICQGRACSPKVFEGVPDRLYINKGDGTFEFVPSATPTVDSKGLGVVAFDLQTRGRPSLFIANDQVPNFLLQNSPSTEKFNIQLENHAFASGLAYTQDGLSVASMGIAADDVNGDGRIDFFVTTFKDEPKILFLQHENGLFVDSTKGSGLFAPGFPFVGWGTQFIDADHDGNMDLVVTNGHVEDYRDEGGDYQMRPQFFHNKGSGKFVELRGSQIGPFFDRKFLGRGLARLDWNGDGRMDFVVSHIGDKASLVTNRTKNVGHFLNVRLNARAGARDATGSLVEVTVEGKPPMTKQLIAGDGYMASNQRMLQFGLSDHTVVESVRVIWPSGSESTVRNVPVDGTIQLIEGRSNGFLHGKSISCVIE